MPKRVYVRLYRYLSICVRGSFPPATTVPRSRFVVSGFIQRFPAGRKFPGARLFRYCGIRGKVGGWNADLSQTYGYNAYTYLVSNSANYTQAYLPGITSSQLQTSLTAGKPILPGNDQSRCIEKSSRTGRLNTPWAPTAGRRLRYKSREVNSYANLTTDKALAGIAGAQVFAGFLPENAGSWNRTSFALYSDNELNITSRWLLAQPCAMSISPISALRSRINLPPATNSPTGSACAPLLPPVSGRLRCSRNIIRKSPRSLSPLPAA